MKYNIGFHFSSFLPNHTLEALPNICPMVKIGTAALIPTIPVNAGSKIKAPPNPAAPDTVAAKKDIVNNIIKSNIN